MATIMGARAVLLDALVGSIEVGKQADLIIVDIHMPNTTPMAYHPAALVYSAGSENVTTTIVNGEILMENRKVLHLDEQAILKNAQKSLDEILERTEHPEEIRWPYE